MAHYIGIDGGGTRTTVGIADSSGRELLRKTGPAGIVDPRRPAATAELLIGLINEAVAGAGLDGGAQALCAGLAGVGNAAERDQVERALRHAGVAGKVAVISDGETALHGALGGGPGILVVSGTGSVAYGRSEDGRTRRCGGWGKYIGDDGGGYEIGRSGLRAALLGLDGRAPETTLLPTLLNVLGLTVPEEIPPWIARAEKSEVAMLAIHVLKEAQQGDHVAREIVAEAALDLAGHVTALMERLGPWSSPPRVVLHGGVARDPLFAPYVERVIEASCGPVQLVKSAADAVTGAIEYARSLT